MPRIKKRLKKQLGFVNILIVALLMGFGLLLSGAFLKPSDIQYKDNPDATPTQAPLAGSPLPVTPASTKDNLELETLKFSTPQPSQACQVEGLVTGGCTCPGQQWAFPSGIVKTDKPEEVCGGSDLCEFQKLCEACNWGATSNGVCSVPPDLVGNSLTPGQAAPATLVCSSTTPGQFGLKEKLALLKGQPFCFGKPVIYLYPKRTTSVDVKLTIPGEIYISIPNYPDGGWKNVVAEPNGTLTYEDKKYSELYYESKVEANFKPKDGIVIASADLKDKLDELTTQLGLKEIERKEFLEYWLPKLNSLNKPYILFSILTSKQKESVDKVSIEPQPDVFINFLAYFKGIDKPVKIEPLKLPPTPKRSGFTAVEWGGTIDGN